MRNHVKTRSARFDGETSAAGAMNREGCSDQYAGYSANDVVERMNGGAVKEERSPLNDAIVFHILVDFTTKVPSYPVVTVEDVL